MAKKDRDDPGAAIVRHDQPMGLANYLEAEAAEDTSLDATKEYRILPRIKVIQSTASGDLKKNFDEGDVIFSPSNVLVAKVVKAEQRSETPFMFVPVYFFVEFMKMSDLKDKGSPTVVARTFDPATDIARRARDNEKRYEGYGEKKKDGFQYTYRYVEALNFPGLIYGPNDHPLKGETCVLQYARGEFSQGKAFISAVNMRKIDPMKPAKMPLWAQVWQFSSGYRDKGEDKKWWGLDHSVAEDASLRQIKQEEVELFKSTHAELKAAHEANKLRVDQSDRDEEAEDVAKEEAKKENKF